MQLCAPCNTPATPPSFDNALLALSKLQCNATMGMTLINKRTLINTTGTNTQDMSLVESNTTGNTQAPQFDIAQHNNNHTNYAQQMQPTPHHDRCDNEATVNTIHRSLGTRRHSTTTVCCSTAQPATGKSGRSGATRRYITYRRRSLSTCRITRTEAPIKDLTVVTHCTQPHHHVL